MGPFQRFILVSLLLAFPNLSAAAQNASASGASPVISPITPGEGIAVLNGPWEFHVGDDPRWAEASFDDSGWQDYTIDPKHPALTAVQALESDALPGWQQHGHPGYTGYAWYRIRLNAPPDAHSLALLMPQYVDDGYEVYVNGQKIGSFGKLDGFRIVYGGRPQVFAVPDGLLHDGQPATLAIRFWNIGYEALPSLHNMAGGLRAAPLLGPAPLIDISQQILHDHNAKAQENN